MGETVAAEMLVPDLPRALARGADAIAGHSRATFLNHPWMLMTLQDRPRVSPNLLRHIEQSAQSVVRAGRSAGHDPALLSGIVTAVDDYTVGYTLRELAVGGSDERGRRIATQFQNAYDEPQRPLSARERRVPDARAASSAPGEPPRMQSFEVGLDWLLDGFEASLRR